MRSIFKTGAAALAVTTMLAGTALAQGYSCRARLRISSDIRRTLRPVRLMESLVRRISTRCTRT